MKYFDILQQFLSKNVQNILKSFQLKVFVNFLPNFGPFLIWFLPLEHPKKITDQCNWSKLKVFDVFYQFCFQNYFSKQQTELIGWTMTHLWFFPYISGTKADRNIISSLPGPLYMSWPLSMSIFKNLG